MKLRHSIGALGMPLLLTSGWAHADTFDTLNLEAGVAAQYDSNLFRLPDGIDPGIEGHDGRSDRILKTHVGLKFDKSWSMQRVMLAASLNQYRHDRYRFLDFNGHNVSAAWLWKITPDLSGNLSYLRTEALNNFSDYRNFSRLNIRTNDTRRFDVDYRAAGGWHALLAVIEQRQLNSEEFQEDSDVRVRSVEPAIEYRFASGNSIAVYTRKGRGEFVERSPNAIAFLDTGFDEHEAGLRAKWQPTGKSAFSVKLGRLSRDHENFGERDFSGTIGQIDYTWDVTGKTRIQAGIARKLNSYQDALSSYYADNTLTLGATWNATAKSAVRLHYSDTRRDYRGAIIPGAPQRDDKLRTWTLSASWKPTKDVTLMPLIQRMTRHSDAPGFQFSATVVALTAQYSF